ncbi:MAG: protein phosphatase 2C domain-containing protein [Muribaculaceae bacterium]|nr:protein phosphatase 2C domain-containing protein [Muribaculaceae bacterium]
MENFSDSTGARGSVESLIGGRSENQDSYGMSETRLGMLVVVCDGMGGGPAGKTASTIATQAILDFVSGSPVDRDPVSVLEDAGVAANEAVMAAVAADPALKGMGTTCVCVLICKGKAFVMHIGDSRCYLLRDGKAVFRTADHSYVGELVRRGTMSEEEARNSRYSNVITRAVGTGPEVIPEVDVVACRPGDRFALMTDGIWGAMPEPQLVVLLCSAGEPPELVTDVVRRTDSIGVASGGGHDNLTLAVVDLPGGSKRTAVTLNDRFADRRRPSPSPNAAVETGEPERNTAARTSWPLWLMGGLLLMAVCVISFMLHREYGRSEAAEHGQSETVRSVVESVRKTDERTPDSGNDDRPASCKNVDANKKPESGEADKVYDCISEDKAGGAAVAGQPDIPAVNASLLRAIEKLKALKDYNVAEKSRDDKKVRQGRLSLLEEAGSQLGRAAELSADAGRRAELEDLRRDMTGGESRRRILSMYRCESSEEAVKEINRYVERISALLAAR